MKFAIIVFIIIVNISSVYAMTLKQAVKEALKNNHSIIAQKYEHSASVYKYKASKALKLPSFFIDSSLTKLDDAKKIVFSTPMGRQSFNFTEDQYINFSTGINLNLYTGGFVSGAISKRHFEEKAVENNMAETKLNVIFKTKIAYINILELEAYRTIAEKHLESLKSHYNDVKHLYNQGIVPYLDVLQTNVKVKEAEQTLTSITNDIKVAKTDLSLILGGKPTDNISVRNIKKRFILKFNIDKLYDLARRNRPVLKMVENKINAANSEMEIAASGYKPKIYISGSYNYSDIIDDMKNKGNFLLRTGIKFQLDWDKSFNEVNAVKEKKLSLINSKKDIVSDILIGVKKAFEDYNSAVSNLKVSTSSVKSAKEYFRSIKLKYNEGLADNSDVLDAEAMLTKSLMTAKTFYFQIIKKYFLLERVTGKDF